MSEYHKIQTVFKRDPATNYKALLDEFSLPEFEYLANCEWEWTEKVDGTNIRVMWDGQSVTFGGRTDRAQIPANLVTKLQQLFMADGCKALLEQFGIDCVTLYGEGYGAKIQKGGGNYMPGGVDFALFDVRIAHWWLQREDVWEIAHNLNIGAAPVMGRGTLYEAVESTKAGVKSSWGDFISEGYVMRPSVELVTRNGSRIITKIKHKDFANEEKK